MSTFQPGTPNISALASPSKFTPEISMNFRLYFIVPSKVRLAPSTPNPLASSSSSSSDKRSQSLELFFRKVYSLASIRSKDLCSKLQISPKVYLQVWQCIIHLLTDPLCLMCNRHLDQIIMCSVYGVCRVNELGVTFKQIIDQYKSQPQAHSKVFDYHQNLVLHCRRSIFRTSDLFVPLDIQRGHFGEAR